MATDSNIDVAIMQMLMERWQKTAMVIARTEEALRERSIQASWDHIAKRIEVLDSKGDLESQGDLSLWRNSEVRLPQPKMDDR